MYDYIALKVEMTPCEEAMTDLIAAFLADINFETFEPSDTGLTAYVRKDKFDEDALKEIICTFPMDTKITYSQDIIEGTDWNKEWEQNYFQPILIDSKLLIRSTFHKSLPHSELEIIIDPKMAFGTGHHSTTAGMARLLMEEDLKDKTVIDMGTGTGILSILAKKLGAGDTIGIDIDEFAIENAKENGILNNTDISWIAGDDKVLKELSAADIFLANINLNVIKDNLAKYLKNTKRGGKIFLSGFFVSDRETIEKEAEKYGLKLKKAIDEKGWQTLLFEKY